MTSGTAGSAAPAAAQRERWGGRTIFIVAAISSAIGLGNIWRFPGVAYDNGGGAFLIPYLAAFLTAGIPVLFLDYAIGHRYRAAPPLAFRRLNKKLEPLGWWQVLVCYVIITYYAVVVAWAGAYVFFSGNLAWGDDAAGFFTADFLRAGDPGFTLSFSPGVLLALLVVWVVATVVLALGLRRGLEVANRVTLPALVVLFLIIVIYSLTLDGAVDGLNAFFTPDWAALAQPGVWIAAYGHIFFSFSVAFGIMLTYSSYLKRKSDLAGSGLVVAFANCSFEILAGIGVFATLGFLAFTAGSTVGELEGLSGVLLAFVTFPTLLAEMPGGNVIGVLFFLSLVFAGFTSLLSLMQVVTGAIQDKTGLKPAPAGILVGLAAGIPSILLYATTNGLNALDVVDAFINNVGVVASAVLMLVLVCLVGRKAPELSAHLSAVSSFTVGRLWRLFVTWITPAVLLVILARGAWDYAVNGYDEYPAWFLGVAGWGMLALIAVLAFALSYQRYRRPGADDFTPDDARELAAELASERAAQNGHTRPADEEGDRR